MMKRLAIAVALLGLAGCARSEPDAVEEVEANLTDDALLNDAAALPTPTPTLQAEVDNAAAAAPTPPPAPALPDDEQIQYDADAAGMTARLPAEDEQPAEGVEEDK